MTTQECGTLRFGRSSISYLIERSTRRGTLTIAVDLPHGVVVQAPRETAAERIAEVVRRKAPWILRRLAEFSELPAPPPPREFVNGESFLYLGRNYRLKAVPQAQGRAASVKLWGGRLHVAYPDGDAQGRPGHIRQALIAWYKDRARKRLTERVALLAERLGAAAPPPVHIRDQAKRWGSCSRRGEVRFNWRVIMAPLPLVDYVVAHEVCHLKLKNHSSAFWRLLRRLMPDYEQRRERLRAMGVQLHF